MIVYGRNAVREAIRGPRRVHTVWATKGARGEFGDALPAAAEQIARRCGSDGHQGVCADVEDYRYADAAALLAAPAPVLVALDEVTDPQNLGAVARTAESAGATGLIIPERRSAEVTPAVCKASYVDPRVVDRFENGDTVAHALQAAAQAPDDRTAQQVLEQAVCQLLSA